MGIQLVDPAKTYELKHPSGAVFVMRHWTFGMQEEVDKRCVVQDGKGKFDYNNSLEREIKINLAVESWSGIAAEDGSEAPCTPEVKRRLPVGVVFWLVKNIDEISLIRMPEEEKKN